MAVPEHAVHYLEIVTPDVEAACHLYGTAYGWVSQQASAWRKPTPKPSRRQEQAALFRPRRHDVQDEQNSDSRSR